MKKRLPLVVMLSLVTMMVALVVLSRGYTVTERVCDGALPRWMLEPQGYELAGCAEVYPSHEAPLDADWTLYCLGVCIGDIEPWRPPR